MNVYVRQLCAALARSGVQCEVFTRADDPACPAVVAVEPGFRVHHVPAGPVAPVPKEQLPTMVGEWTDAVRARLAKLDREGVAVDAIHANYWLSGQAGHVLKHELDVPLVVTFHTLDRVKADASPEELWAHEPARRAAAEADIVRCADAVLASCDVEAEQLATLYGAEPGRVAVVAPGVEHAFFGPGDRAQARRAIGFATDEPIVLFVGRIQPLKGPATAVEAVSLVQRDGPRARLVLIGGPSGPHGSEELAAVQARVKALGIGDRVHLLPAQPHEMLSTFYRAADACLVPSHSESFGLVALEAAACGVPVVASAVGGLTTLIDHGRTGYLVDSRRAEDFARPLGWLLRDPALAARLGRAAAES
ncbi:MAG: glycosyltransferase, partial [Acidimicrobiaceae bacterium]|nr:glycosyltransferase [Acidimicrobiaceae bacterium]